MLNETIKKVRSRHLALIGATLLMGLVSLPAPVALAASKIAVLVNNQPITSNDIKRRAAFVKLRRMKGNSTTLARNELIEDALKLQEARRQGIRVPNARVDSSYANFAKSNKMPVKALNSILSRSGVTVRGFKQFIRAQIAWQTLLARRSNAENRPSKSGGALSYLHGGGSGRAAETTEYTVQQIVFVVPGKNLKKGQNARMNEANNFRRQFPGCEKSLAFAGGLKNVSVLKRGRTQAHQLPPQWRKEIESTAVGKTTRPIKTSKGLELMAVCKSRQVRSSKQEQAKSGDIFAREAASAPAQGNALSKKYMAELRKVAVIKNR